MKRTFVVAVVVLSALAGGAAAAQPCWQAAVEDWYDNGVFDRRWECDCLREAIDHLPADGTSDSTVRDDFQRQLASGNCAGSITAQEVRPVTPSRGADKAISISVNDDPPTGKILLVVGIVVLLTLAIALRVVSKRRA